MKTLNKIYISLAALSVIGGFAIYFKSQNSTFRNYFNKPEKLGTAYPRGVRNNNPGNLVLTSESWKGKVKNNTDGKFEQFQTYEFGVRALLIDIKNDIKKGKNTIEKLITEYAPKNENDTTAYINKVASNTGLKKDATLDTSRNTLFALCMSIIMQENGLQSNGKAYLTSEQFEAAYKMM